MMSKMKLCVLTVVIGLVWGCGKGDHQFVAVEQGPFQRTLTETGELQAVRYTIIAMPSFNWNYGRPKITELEVEGKTVEKGDVVGRIETSGVVQEKGRKESDLAIAQADLNKMRVQHKNKLRELRSKIKGRESSLNLAKVDQQRLRFESERRRTLNELALQKIEYELKKFQMQLETAQIVQAEELQIQEAKLQKLRAAIAKAERTIETFTLRAPAPGLIEYRQNRSTRQKMAVGDQLYPGRAIMGLPDLSQMKAQTAVAETDIDKVFIGQKVMVRLDAFPKFVYEAEITDISRISRNKSRNDPSKVFDVEVLLKKSDSLLRPGMTVSCEFLIADFKEALLVRNNCIHRDNGEFVVYVKDFWGTKRVPITVGPRNAQKVVVTGDLKAGDQVVVMPEGAT